MGVLKGDFLGFTFNNSHSSDLGIIRVSGGSRYSKNLLPSLQDTAEPIPGGDGMYYWNSHYTQNQIPISFAYDSLTEEQIRKLKQTFGTKKISELIFDEEPYKVYSVKVSSPPQLNFICFEENGQRIYKGEGNIQFVAYYPYARCYKKYLDMYDERKYPTKNEWAKASGLKDTKGNYDAIGSRSVSVYNGGDLETDFKLYIGITDKGTGQNDIDYIGLDGTPLLYISSFKKQSAKDKYIRINSKTNLIEGCDENWQSTGTLYNKFITSGDFFKLPLGESTLNIGQANCAKIEYDYLYY